MAFQIRQIEFETEVPSLDKISKFIEEKCSQNIVISEREFKGQYSVTFDKYPNDILDFKKEYHKIVIYGDAGAAPALFELFYTCLVLLGGKVLPNIELLKLPISDKDIEEINDKTRKEIKQFGSYIWLYLLVSLFLFGGLIYLVFSWVL